MQVLRSLFRQEPNEQSSLRFTPRININPKSTLYVEVQPRDPTTTSNIIITAFASAQIRSIVPIRVEWSRFKVKVDSPHTTEKIHCLSGNTYMCEPGDVGGYIKAVIRSVDESIGGEAEVVVGPIGIDVMVKRVIDGALYAGSLLSQVVVCERNRKNNVTVRLHARTIQFIDDASQEKLVKEYSISQPKLELNPKDPTRVYMRFQTDQTNTVREWLDKIFNLEEVSAEESSLSIRVPYSSHSSNSSKMRLFQKSQGPCPNKFQLRFISRVSRDLFLFTQRAFVCRQDMKNSLYIQRIQTLQNLATEQDYRKFLEYMSLKWEIVRIAEYAKEVEEDRDAKVRDLNSMEESIGEMTLTYLKIIEEKGKNEKIDFQHSYSQISHTREEILNRKQFRQLKAQNEALKVRLRQLNQQIDLLKFFKKEDNQSMILNQTSNPFTKKPNDSVTPLGSPDRSALKGMHELSINYANLLQENRVLKSENRQLKGDAMGKKKPLDRSQNMMELLGSLDEREERQAREAKFVQYQQIINSLKKENEQMRKRLNEATQKRGVAITRQSRYVPHQEDPSFVNNHSVINQSITSNNSSVLNCSITSEAAILKLQQNLEQLTRINQKLQEESARLRKQRDYYRAQFNKMKEYIKQFEDSNRVSDSQLESELLNKYRQQNEQLQNQKKALLRKLESISKENAQGLKEEYLSRQKKIKQLQITVSKLTQDNISLSKERQNKISSEDLQMLSNQNNKLKKINLQLIEEVKNLKMQMEKLKDEDMYNSRVIELQNQLAIAKADVTPNKSSAAMLDQLNQLSKQNARLKQENEEKSLKLQHQAATIEKLMGQHRRHSPQAKPSSSQSTSSKEKDKCYSQKCNPVTIQEVQKYRRQIKKLQQQILFIKRNEEVHNRSREFSLGVDYYEERLEIKQKQLDALYLQNENLSKMCERYGKDAREANKELNKCRQKLLALMKSKHEDSSLLLND